MNLKDRRRMEVNLRKWDESVPLHVESPTYDLASFKKGKSTLLSVELKEMGPVKGLSLLHLQCHFGLDTLSWARRGAKVTGVDFSPAAIGTARSLALELGIPAKFIRANVLDLLQRPIGTFDAVYTGKGALWWLPDLRLWGRVVASALRPGGRFMMLEGHPICNCYDNDDSAKRLVLTESYFRRRALREVYDGTYATSVKMRHRVSYGWIHPASEVLNSLIGGGLRIDSVREYPYTHWKAFPFMKQGKDGYWRLERGRGTIPLMWSVTASKPVRG